MQWRIVVEKTSLQLSLNIMSNLKPKNVPKIAAFKNKKSLSNPPKKTEAATSSKILYLEIYNSNFTTHKPSVHFWDS